MVFISFPGIQGGITFCRIRTSSSWVLIFVHAASRAGCWKVLTAPRVFDIMFPSLTSIKGNCAGNRILEGNRSIYEREQLRTRPR